MVRCLKRYRGTGRFAVYQAGGERSQVFAVISIRHEKLDVAGMAKKLVVDGASCRGDSATRQDMLPEWQGVNHRSWRGRDSSSGHHTEMPLSNPLTSHT